MSLLRWFGVGLALAVGAGAGAGEKDEAKRREARELLATVKGEGFYRLRDPKPREVVAKIQALGADAAPAVAELLAEGLKKRDDGWIQVYRPLYILEGLGEHAKLALPDIVKALDDEHPINVSQASRVLAKIGPGAKAALPKLEAIWTAEPKSLAKDEAGKAITAIDPKAAEKLGVK